MESLAALEGEDQEHVLALARRRIEHIAGAAQSLEALFAQTRAFEAGAETSWSAGAGNSRSHQYQQVPRVSISGTVTSRRSGSGSSAVR